MDSIDSQRTVCSDIVVKNWRIDRVDLLRLLTEFDTLSGKEWHDCYGTFDCSIDGEVILNTVRYSYFLNAGGWARIWNKSHEQFVGSHNKQDSVYFLSTNLCNEVWN